MSVDEDWDQEVRVYVGGTTPFYHAITPQSGAVQISVKTDAGRAYWNGSAFVAGSAIDLATTIVGNSSRYSFQRPLANYGDDILFTGWIVRNGKPTPPRHVTHGPITAAQARAGAPPTIRIAAA